MWYSINRRVHRSAVRILHLPLECKSTLVNVRLNAYKAHISHSCRMDTTPYNADNDKLLSKSDWSALLVRLLRVLLIEVFECVREINPEFMNMIFTLNNKPYNTRSGPLLFLLMLKESNTGLFHVYIKQPDNRILYLPMLTLLNALMYVRIT